MVVVQMGEQHGGMEGNAGGLQGGVQVVAQGAQAGPQIEDQGWLPVHLHQHAGRIAPVSALLVGGARARAPDTEEGEFSPQVQASRTATGRRRLPSDPWTSSGDRQRHRLRLPAATGRPTGRWPCACTASPTPPIPGDTCSPAWPKPGSTPSPPSCAATPRPRCPPTAATTPGRWPSTPAPSTRPWGATRTPSSSATTGGRSPPTAPPPTNPSAGAGWSRRRGPPRHRWPTGSSAFDQLRRSWYVFFFQTALAEYAVAHGRLRLHRPAVVRLVPGVRRVVGRRPGQGGPGLAREPRRRHRVLPGHVRRAPRRPRGSRRPGRRRDDDPPAHPVPPRRRRRLHGHRRPSDR